MIEADRETKKSKQIHEFDKENLHLLTGSGAFVHITRSSSGDEVCSVVSEL